MANQLQDGKTETPTDELSSPFKSAFKHPALVRKNERIFLLLSPGSNATFEVGQVKEFVLFDQHLRQGGIVDTVPFGYSLFAEKYNEGAECLGRFATFSLGVVGSHLTVKPDGEPIKWETFKIDDSLVGWDRSKERKEGTEESFVVVDSEQASSQKKELDEIATKLKTRIKLLHTINAFYNARALVERRFSHGLAELSSILSNAVDPIPELENSLSTLRLEARAQADFHSKDADKVYSDFIPETLAMIQKSETFLNKALNPLLKKFSNNPDESDSQQQTNIENLLVSYRRLEAAQLESIKDKLWDYSNLVSGACVNDDDSSEKLRLALENFELSDEDQPYIWDSSLDLSGADLTPVSSPKPDATIPRLDDAEHETHTRPLPKIVPINYESHTIIPRSILFYVKALHDYTTTVPEEFDFKVGDIIAVLKVRKSGWWTGEPILGDETVKTGKKVFPSNYVTIL
ncbi:hypothetical protein CPB83DRAFT_862169 [Crepidotus variabilis]|uniref:SH3 domain-containing protein n=1 Tax=Crepidotus variabilis TaxID=179855 RepID=A0A9P6E7J0_9AGAR|nr:hypothetical protein CPB83DRAFT_862169 [Crepidotus variabilis]